MNLPRLLLLLLTVPAVLPGLEPLHAQDAAAHAGAGPTKLDEVRIYLILRDDGKLIGELAGYDARQIRVRDRQGNLVSVTWDRFKPMGCYYLQKRLTDPNSAEVNFRLGYYCYVNGMKQDAQAHFTKCRELDPAYAEKIKSIYLGTFRGNVGLPIALVDPKEFEELERLERGGHSPTEPVDDRPPATLVKYQKFTPATQIKALEQIRTFGEQVNEKMSSSLRTVETEHYVIFTDWPASEDRPLGAMFESMYERLCRQFDIPTDENIFLGKMPVFCWNRREDFVRFADEIDKLPVRAATAAYVRANFNGFQQMNMFRSSNRLLLEKVVAHESVHTFMNRYRSNVPLCNWLNEGLAEVMSGTMVPRAGTLERSRAASREAVRRKVDTADMLNDGYTQIKPSQYPLACTMVDYLMRKDPARFVTLVDRVKSGTKTEAALKAAYGLDYEGLDAAWRQWVSANYPKL